MAPQLYLYQDSEIRESISKLNKWHIRPLLNGTYCVEGQIQQEGSCRAEHHLSGSIALRHSNTQIETVQGVRYRLVGRIQKTAALAAGISKSTLHHFVKGIPSNWKEILDDALDGESTDTHQDSVNVSACQASGSKNAANSRLTDSIGKGSRDDPLTIDDLPKSRRSSRLKFPPLAFWTGQRVFVDPRTNVTTVMKGNDNAIPADMFYFEAADDTQLESTTTISRRSRKSCSPERTSVLESEQIESKTTSPGNKRKNSRVSSVESDQCKALETLDASKSASPAKQKRGRTRKSNILAIAAGSVLETNVVAARSNVTASTNQHTSKSQQLREKIRSCTTSKQSKDDASSRTTRSVDKSSERTNRGFKIRDASDKNEKSSKKTQEADVSIRKHDKPTTRNGNKSATFSTSKTLGLMEKPYVCLECDEKFGQLFLLAIHMQNHDGEKAVTCDECDQEFSKISDFEKHVRSHTFENLFVCSECKREFSKQANLDAHIRRIHSKNGPLACDVCNKRFLIKAKLDLHMAVHNGEKPFECYECSLRFAYKTSLIVHMRTHSEETQFACGICGKMYPQKCRLYVHMRIHTGEKPYACNECNKTFARSNVFRVHQKIHNGEKKFACTECDKKFTMKQQLHRHEKIHTGDKQYVCGECNVKFVQKTNLVEHMKVHTGEKLFACGTCKREFRRRTHLKTHVENNSCFFFKNLVPKIVEKRFPCEVCGKKFGTNGHLKRHRINVHKFPKSYIPVPYCVDDRKEEKIRKADKV